MAAISVGRQQGAKYDFGFADASGNFIGLMCVRDPKTGAPMYKEWSDPGLSQQYFSGQVGYANLEPQKELQFGSMTHHHGFGAEFFSGPNRYYMGTDWDNRFKGRGILGPKATAVTLPSVLSLVDVGLELWDDANTLTNWTYSESHATSSLTRESTTVDSGTYAATIFVHVNGGQYGQITQEASSWDNAYRGTTFCISARCYSTDIAKVLGSMIITDGTNTTTVTATVDTTWENLVATHKIADDATKLEVTLKGTIATGGASTVIFDSVKFPIVGAKGAHFAEFDDDLFISYGTYLLRMSNSTGAVSVVAGFPTDIVGLTHHADGRLYIFIESDDVFSKDSGIDTNEALDVSEVEITCDADPSTAIPIGSIITIESELMYVSNSESAGSLLTVVRGILGTNAVAHDTAKSVYLRDNYYYYMDLSENVTRSDSVKDFGTKIGNTMYGVVVPNMVFTATDPTTDTWSSETTVGSISDDITSLIGVAGVPYVMKEDMPYYIDSDGNPQELAPQLLSEKTSTSGAAAVEWQGNLYIPCGAQALWEYDTGSAIITDISPSKYITGSTEFDGIIQGLVGDSSYLYCAIDDGSNIQIIAGRWETIGSSVQFVWHSLSELALTGCEKLYASSVYKKRLYVSSTSSGDSLYYYPLTTMYGNIKSDTNYTYQTGGSCQTSWLPFNMMADSKGVVKITLIMADTTTNIYMRAYYQKLGDSSWTEISSTAKFKTSPTTTAYLPVDGSSNKPATTMMRFKFEGVTNDTSKSPIFYGYDIRALWFPNRKRVVMATVRVADRIMLNNGMEDPDQNGDAIRAALEAWDEPTASWPRAFYPLYWESSGDTVYAMLLPTYNQPFMESVVVEGNADNIEYQANLSIMIVDGVTF